MITRLLGDSFTVTDQIQTFSTVPYPTLFPVLLILQKPPKFFISAAAMLHLLTLRRKSPDTTFLSFHSFIMLNSLFQ